MSMWKIHVTRSYVALILQRQCACPLIPSSPLTSCPCISTILEHSGLDCCHPAFCTGAPRRLQAVTQIHLLQLQVALKLCWPVPSATIPLFPQPLPAPPRISTFSKSSYFLVHEKMKARRLGPLSSLPSTYTRKTLTQSFPLLLFQGDSCLQFKANPSIWPLPPPQGALALLILSSISFTPSLPSLDLSWQHVNIFISTPPFHTTLSPNNSPFSFKVCRGYPVTVVSAFNSHPLEGLLQSGTHP